jgi:hypothetical protein
LAFPPGVQILIWSHNDIRIENQNQISIQVQWKTISTFMTACRSFHIVSFLNLVIGIWFHWEFWVSFHLISLRSSIWISTLVRLWVWSWLSVSVSVSVSRSNWSGDENKTQNQQGNEWN